MTRLACMTVFFMDGTKAVFRYPKQSGSDAATISATVKRGPAPARGAGTAATGGTR